MCAYVGIDVGNHGAIAVITPQSVAAYEIPKTSGKFDLLKFFELMKEIKQKHKIKIVAIEKAQAMPKQGVVSMFRYGYHCGQIEGIILALGLPYVLVSPHTWQKPMFVGVEGCQNSKHKAYTVFCRLFSQYIDIVKTKKSFSDGKVDAILIAEWCRTYAAKA
jgi:crossover junction endodeoxyribonuclease RuvC